MAWTNKPLEGRRLTRGIGRRLTAGFERIRRRLSIRRRD
jgi:hypothetical protein